MAVANARTTIGADKAKDKASLLIIDCLPRMAMIENVRLMSHSIVPVINTVHPVYGAGNSKLSGKLYVQNDDIPATRMLAIVPIIDIIASLWYSCTVVN